MIDKNCINDDYITTKIKRAIIKKVNQLKTAKIKVKGNYQIAVILVCLHFLRSKISQK